MERELSKIMLKKVLNDYTLDGSYKFSKNRIIVVLQEFYGIKAKTASKIFENSEPNLNKIIREDECNGKTICLYALKD